MFRVAVLSLWVASSALAQTTVTLPFTIRQLGSGAESLSFGPDQCLTTLQFTWDATLLRGNFCTGLQLWATELDCGDAPVAGDVAIDTIDVFTLTATRTGQSEIDLNKLPGFSAEADAGVVCGDLGKEKTFRICGNIYIQGVDCGINNRSPQDASPLELTYDTLPPAPPVISSTASLDQSISVRFTLSDSDAVQVLAEIRAEGDSGSTDFVAAGEAVAATAKSITIKNLTNYTTYDVRLRSEDAAGNISDPSEIASATPIKTVGFWETYRNDGGQEQGGCSTTSLIWSVPALAALARLLSRRKL